MVWRLVRQERRLVPFLGCRLRGPQSRPEPSGWCLDCRVSPAAGLAALPRPLTAVRSLVRRTRLPDPSAQQTSRLDLCLWRRLGRLRSVLASPIARSPRRALGPGPAPRWRLERSRGSRVRSPAGLQNTSRRPPWLRWERATAWGETTIVLARVPVPRLRARAMRAR